MDANAMGAIGAVYILGLVILGIALVVAWIVLPFALIGTKGLLRELIFETKQTNKLLSSMAANRQPPLVQISTPAAAPTRQ